MGELDEPMAEEEGLTAEGSRPDAGAGKGQPGTRQPGAGQSGRQRHQICRAFPTETGSWSSAPRSLVALPAKSGLAACCFV